MNENIKLVLGFLISLVLVLVVMPSYIKMLKKRNLNQQVSEYALDEYKEKGKTPIMGGLLFVVFPLLAIVIVNPTIYQDPKALMIMLAYFLFCLVGFIDDFLILIMKNNLGLSPKLKMLMQIVFAALLFIFFRNEMNYSLAIPMCDAEINLGMILFGLFFVFVFCAESNAVNFTDGMDGLCAGVSAICLLPFLVFAILADEYNIALIILAVIGGLIGYLKFNFFPAKIFMGDSGSLALGALFAAIAFALDMELILLIVGGVFLWEMFCVCAQITCVKLFHRRIFKYTPIHYAFVLRGLKEKKVVLIFYGIATICAIVGLVIGVI